LRTTLSKSVAGIVALLALSGIARLAQAQPQGSATLEEVKAAYLYNFAKFVQWPAAPQQAFRICILGNSSLQPNLEATVKGETLQGHPIEVKRTSSVADATNSCNMVYIAPTERGRLNDILRALSGKGILTVSDIPDFVNKGGMIGFVREDNRVRFAANQAAAQSAGLTLSSELLKVAVSVKTEAKR